MGSLSDIPIDVPTHHASTFDFDDAFSDGESNEIAYQFSVDTVREELARNIPSVEGSWSEPEGPPPLSDTFGISNLSVSTLDIIGDEQQTSRSSVPSLTPSSSSQKSLGISDHFSPISLSRSNSGALRRSSESLTLGKDDSVDESYASHPSGVSLESDLGYHHNDAKAVDYSQTALQNPLEMAKSTQSLPAPIPTSHQEPPPMNAIITSPITPPLPLSTSEPHSTSLPSSSSTLSTPQSHQKPSGHRPTRSTGISPFEKVRSKTRPVFLPPKPRGEDKKHMADWQSMMKLSRAAAEKKRNTIQDRRLAREKHIADSIYTWEKEIVPDWRVVHKDPALRKLWWKGIPTKHRASLWERAVGNALALNKDHYRTCLSRAKRALSSGAFPQASLSLIEEDISTTLPALHIFHRETGPLYADLKEMLCAWVVSRSDEGLGYTLGAAKIAAMILINMPVQQGFVVMRNLLERHCMRSFYGGEGSYEDVEAYYRIFDTLLADGMPKIYFNFKQHQISPSAYLIDWLVPVFLNHLPLEACARVWDVLLLEGDSFLYRTALAVLAVLEPRLFFPDRRELLELLKGENKAALDVARREGRPLDGGKYEIYGVDEERLWERIDDMEEWWKESTWARLLQRELPDL